MEASPARVIQYFNGEKQNLIPLFQRPYTWTEGNWQTFWDDLMLQYETGDTGTHFMGAIVSVPARSTPVGVSKFLIIDGQQRLTTVALLLCALRDALRDSGDMKSASRIQEVYLINRYREPEDTFKFVPTQADREIYLSIASDPPSLPGSDKGIRMANAYHFFKNKISNGQDSNNNLLDRTKVLTTLEQCLQVVMINLGDDDDPYLIFESLNFKGEPLTQADLVRNYLLMQFQHSISAGGEQERIHSKYWIPLENALKSNLTEFLRHYIMKDGEDIKKGGIYIAIKSRLNKKKSPTEVENEIQSIKRSSDFYAKFIFPDQEENKSIRNRLGNIKDIQVTTAYPLLLRLFDVYEANKIDAVELEKCLGIIESFMIRRSVCGVPSNPLSKLFIQLSKGFPSENYSQWLLDSLLSFSGNRRFPKDAEFEESFMSQAQYGRSTTQFILQRLEKSFGHKEVVNLSTATIEHILPQTLTKTWQEELGSEYESLHSSLLNVFGNLTLTAYNSELSNLPFSDKKDKLRDTHIELNKWILEQSNWREQEIKERAKLLFVKASEIWNIPLQATSNQ